ADSFRDPWSRSRGRTGNPCVGPRRLLAWSGPVVRVDSHVLGAQIARPHGRRGAAGSEIDSDGDLLALEILGRLRRALVVRLAVFEQDDRSQCPRRAPPL